MTSITSEETLVFSIMQIADATTVLGGVVLSHAEFMENSVFKVRKFLDETIFLDKN